MDDFAFPQPLVRGLGALPEGLGAAPQWVFNPTYWVYVGNETNGWAPTGSPTAFSADGSVAQGHWVMGMLTPPPPIAHPTTMPVLWLWYPMAGQTIVVNGRQVTSGSGEGGVGPFGGGGIGGSSKYTSVPGFTQKMSDYWVKTPPPPRAPSFPGGKGSTVR